MRPTPVHVITRIAESARVRTGVHPRSPLNKSPLRRYSQNSSPAPDPHTRSMLPYFVGGVAGVATVGTAGYAYYHLSGAKKIVDKASAVKARVEAQTAVVQEKGEAARKKMGALTQTARDMAREHKGDLRVRWTARSSNGKASDKPTEQK